MPITDEWQQAITDYYAAQGFTVMSLSAQAQLLDVVEQRVGEYRCVNAQGQLGAWTGTVPADAIAAVEVRVQTDNADAVRTTADVTLASSGNGWSVVAETSGPAASPSIAG